MYTFYVELDDGSVKMEEGLTKLQAVRRYNKAVKVCGLEFKNCGWHLTDVSQLSQQILRKKAA